MTHTHPCFTCELIARRDAGTAPLWDNIHHTRSWNVGHSKITSLPGWLVLAAHRHIEAIDELTDDEAAELGLLLRYASAAMREVVGCFMNYVVRL